VKRWLWCAGALLLAAVLGGMPFVGTDIAKLHPAEVLRVQKTGDIIFVELDTGDSGKGKTLETAIQDLKESTPGKVFLETVEYLLINGEAEALLERLSEYLRPACGVCLEDGTVKLGEVAEFLGTHTPGLILQEYRAGDHSLQKLVVREERMYFVS
jgi:hypothetical protein